jgi:hypothetical protein
MFRFNPLPSLAKIIVALVGFGVGLYGLYFSIKNSQDVVSIPTTFGAFIFVYFASLFELMLTGYVVFGNRLPPLKNFQFLLRMLLAFVGIAFLVLAFFSFPVSQYNWFPIQHATYFSPSQESFFPTNLNFSLNNNSFIILHGSIELSGKGGLSSGHIIKIGLRLWIPSVLNSSSENITVIKLFANGAYFAPLPKSLSYSALTPVEANTSISPKESSRNSSGVMWANNVDCEYLTSGNFSATILFSLGSSQKQITTSNIISVAGSDVTAQYFLGAVGTSIGFLLIGLTMIAFVTEYSTDRRENTSSDRAPEEKRPPKVNIIGADISQPIISN